MLKKILIIILMFSFITHINAEQRNNYIKNAKVYVNNDLKDKLTDNKYSTYTSIKKNNKITIKSKKKFDSIYIIYYLKSSTGVIDYNGYTMNIGTNNYLHEFISLNEYTYNLKIKYDNFVTIKEIYLFSGDIPEWVQIWEEPLNNADLMLLSTHSDDEHLFFAGLIPTMIANNKKVQVVYFTNHNNNPIRLDEQLNGLWKVGVKNYPILGTIPDEYSTNLEDAISNLEYYDLDENDGIKYIVDNIKSINPSIIVSHDELGEYSHGQHILCTDALKKALNKLNDEELPDKVYLHLYNENKITMNYDIPLDYYNGLTAYEVSKLGYKEHNSQQYTWFTKWLNGKDNEYKSATEIEKYSPLEYGLYFSKVGYEDTNNDMFSNITVKKNIIEKKEVKQEKKKIKKSIKTNNIYKYTPIYIFLGLLEVLFFTLLFISLRIRKKHRSSRY